MKLLKLLILMQLINPVIRLYLFFYISVSKKLNERNSHLHMFFKIGALENFAIFTEKHLCWSLFLIKFVALKAILGPKV